MQKPICVDDFGNEVFRCFWTKSPVSIVDAVMTGGFYPGVKSVHISCKDYKEARRASKRAFDEMDKNCNACKHLERANHEKSRAGFLYGTCKVDSKEKKLYPMHNGLMMFHPDDFMGMDCWESR